MGELFDLQQEFENNVDRIPAQIYTEAVFDKENSSMRYSLTRTWDSVKEKATLVLMNPSKANQFKSDYTVTRCMNYLIDYEDGRYGSLEVVNLFAKMETKSGKVKGKMAEVGKYNDDAIRLAVDQAKIVIVGWGSAKKFKWRIKEVLELLKPYENKLYHFRDNSGRSEIILHPVVLGEPHRLFKLNFEAVYNWAIERE